MVEHGSFYRTGLLPGTYNMIAQLDNGKEAFLTRSRLESTQPTIST